MGHSKENQQPKTSQNALFLAGALVVSVLATLFFSAQPRAQITATSRAILNSPDEIVPLGSHIYVTLDPERKLSYNVMINRHQSNTRGVRKDQNILNLGASRSPVWLVFSVLNNSNTQDWVLDFGSMFDGRLAMAHKILVHNHTTGLTFSRALGQEGQEDTPPQGPAVPVKISQDQINLFVVFFEAEGGLPSLIAPQMVRQDYYINKSATLSLPTIITFTLLTLIAGFFIAAALLTKQGFYTLLSVYFFTGLLLYGVIQNLFYAGNPLLNDTIAVLFAAFTLLSLAGGKYFLGIQRDEQQDRKILLALGLFIAGITIANIVLWSANNIAGMGVLFTSGLGATGLLAYLGFSQAQYSKLHGVPYAFGCITLVIGGVISAAAASDYIAATPMTLHGFWIALILQGVLFISAARIKIKTEEENERQRIERENREAESLARLKQSKESADQSRLLRVIERERELMTELREREMQRTEEMRRAKEQADEANRAKSAFLAVVSHEIRTPMTGLMGMIRLLLESKMNAQQHDYMLAMQKSGDTMMALLNDILDFEKIESGSMEMENVDFDLPRLVQGVVTLMSAHAGEKGLTLNADIQGDVPRFVKGDPTRLRQILLNLVNNALKFTQEGGVTITLKATPVDNLPAEIKGDFEVYFGVTDTGIGISQEAQEKLFTPFSQADSSIARKFGGTGLGLTICKRLVETMGGMIALESKEGVGTTFSFSLLMVAAQKSDADERVAAKPAAIPRKEHVPSQNILIVDDNEMNRKVLEGFLSKSGHKITHSESAEEALEICARKKFDLIFMDINMHGMSGIEAAQALRAMPPPAGITPIIALTGNVRDEDVQTYYAVNINGFLAKPIDPEKLSAIIHSAYNGIFENPVGTIEDTSTEGGNAIPKALNLDEAVDTFSLALEGEEARVPHVQATQPDTEQDENLFDWEMLESLLESLGVEQLTGLIEGFLDKAKELLDALTQASKNKDGAAIVGRSHELKGMAANFGMARLSYLAKTIEHAASTGELEKARQQITKLPDAFDTSEAKLAVWIAKNRK